MMLRRPALALALALAALAGPASADTVDAATKATARAVAEEGLAHFDAGRWQAALDRFERAAALVHAPTMSLMAARCLEKLGRLVDANERYLVAARAKLEPGASDAFKAAVSDADREQKALLPRIPRLAVGLRGASAGEVEVTLDGKRLPTAMLGVERLTDPGEHRLSGKRGDEVVEQGAELKEGQSLEVVLAFKGGGGAAPGGAQRGLGWAGVGLGGAGLVMGAVTLGIGVSVKSTLINKDGCSQELVCPNTTQAAADLHTFRALRPLPAVGFIAGAALLGTGIALVVTAPKGALPEKAAVRPWIGPGSAGLAGVF